jgi:hypothetical protein
MWRNTLKLHRLLAAFPLPWEGALVVTARHEEKRADAVRLSGIVECVIDSRRPPRSAARGQTSLPLLRIREPGDGRSPPRFDAFGPTVNLMREVDRPQMQRQLSNTPRSHAKS